MPIVINKPITSIKSVAKTLLDIIIGVTEFTKASIAPVDFITEAKPAATSITKAT